MSNLSADLWTISIFYTNITNMPPTVFFSQNPKVTARMGSRHRPLHACGVSILAIADIAFAKSQDINGPLGSTLRRVAKSAKFATPFIYTIQYIWLAILSFMDCYILAAEKLTEKLFPPSTYVFDKIDEIVLMIVSLPEKFDGAVTMFPTIIHQVPLLEWALKCVISRLNGLASTLNHWGQENSRIIEEKTIGVDRTCNEHNMEDSRGHLPIMDSSNAINSESFPPMSEASEDKSYIKGVNEMAVSSHMKGSYKEALERGKEENTHEKQVDGDECEEGKKNDGNNEENESIVKYQVERSESIKDDPLLELFESAWLMKPARY